MHSISDTLLERIRSQRESGTLDLSLCKISNIPVRAIKDHYGGPKSLDLSYNLIRYLKPMFVLDMKDLTKLNLARNELQKLPDNFGDMHQLVHLDIHENQLKTLPLSMEKLKNLKYLDISKNPFRAPISTLLNEQQEGVITVSSQLILQFLRGVTKELSFDEPKESLKIYKRRKSITFKDDMENDYKANFDAQSKSTTKISHPTKYLTLQQISRNLSSNPVSPTGTKSGSSHVWGIAAITLVVILMIPLLLAVAIDSSYLDRLADDTLLFAEVWRKYKPYHCYLQNVVNCCQPYRALIVRSPMPKLEDIGLFSFIRNGFAKMFSYVTNLVCFK